MIGYVDGDDAAAWDAFVASGRTGGRGRKWLIVVAGCMAAAAAVAGALVALGVISLGGSSSRPAALAMPPKIGNYQLQGPVAGHAIDQLRSRAGAADAFSDVGAGAYAQGAIRVAAIAGHFSLDAAGSSAHTGQFLDSFLGSGNPVIVAVPNVACIEAPDATVRCAWAAFSTFGVVEGPAALPPSQVAALTNELRQQIR